MFLKEFPYIKENYRKNLVSQEKYWTFDFQVLITLFYFNLKNMLASILSCLQKQKLRTAAMWHTVLKHQIFEQDLAGVIGLSFHYLLLQNACLSRTSQSRLHWLLYFGIFCASCRLKFFVLLITFYLMWLHIQKMAAHIKLCR